MFTWLRKKLHLDQIQEDQSMMINWQKNMQKELFTIREQHKLSTQALGRIIAKLDPMYGKPEIDVDRKTDSDRIGEDVINRLKAEAMARKPDNY